MKALAKVYSSLGSVRFLVLLLAVFSLSLGMYLWGKFSFPSPKSKPSSDFVCSRNGEVRFTAGNQSYVLSLSETTLVHPFDFEGEHWGAVAVKAVYIGDAIADLLEKNRIHKEPLVGFIQDAQNKEYIVLISKKGELAVSSVAWLLQNALSNLGGSIEVKVSEERACGSFFFKLAALLF